MGPLEAYIAIHINATSGRAAIRWAGTPYLGYVQSMYEEPIRSSEISDEPFGGTVVDPDNVRWYEVWGRVLAPQYEIDEATDYYLENFRREKIGGIPKGINDPLEFAKLHAEVIRTSNGVDDNVLTHYATIDWLTVFARLSNREEIK